MELVHVVFQMRECVCQIWQQWYERDSHGSLRQRLSTGALLARYRDPHKPGSLRGLTQFAKANGISVKRVREVLQRDLGYTLHKPRRRRFPTSPMMVFGMDEQHCQVQSRVPKSLDGGGRVFQVRLGRACKKQDGKSGDGRHGQDLETQ